MTPRSATEMYSALGAVRLILTLPPQGLIFWNLWIVPKPQDPLVFSATYLNLAQSRALWGSISTCITPLYQGSS